MTTEVIDSTDKLHTLGAEWQSLAARSAGHHWFHTYTWCGAVWRHAGEPSGQRLRIIIVRHDGRLVLVWPLVVDGRVLKMLNSGTLEYRDLLIEAVGDDAVGVQLRQAWLDAAWRVFVGLRGPSIFAFQNLREPSHVAALLQDRLKSRPHTGDWTTVIRLDRYAGWSDYEKTHLPKALVSDQRRQWRRARQQHPGIEVFRVVDPDEVKTTLAWMLEHKLRWLDAHGKPAPRFRTPAFARLLEDAAQVALRQGALGMFRLSDKQHVLSAGYGLREGDEFLFHVFAYDAAHGGLSPSRLLLEGMLRWCFDTGVRTFDFMPGFAPYKKIWANDVIATSSFVGDLNLRGRCLLAGHARYQRTAVRWQQSPLRRLLAAAWERLPNRPRSAVTAWLSRSGVSTLNAMDTMRPPPELAQGTAQRGPPSDLAPEKRTPC